MNAEQASNTIDARALQTTYRRLRSRLSQWVDRSPRIMFLLPAILIVLFLSIFPLIASIYLSFSRIRLVRGGYEITFVRYLNYRKLLKGSEERHFLGKYAEPSDFWKAVFVLLVIFAAYFVVYRFLKHLRHNRFNLIFIGITLVFSIGLAWLIPTTLTGQLLPGTLEIRQLMGKYGDPPILWRTTIFWSSIGLTAYYVIVQWINHAPINIFGFAFRVATVGFAATLLWLALITLNDDGLPGTLIVTFIFVFIGIFFQYIIGLGLALLVTQNLPGRRFFRVIFLLPMMITPIGIGFLFRMLTDTLNGPFSSIWRAAGWEDFSWVNTPFGARAAIIIGDTWQWTPFAFIILLAALEGTSQDTIEAALVDGANRLQLFRYIIIPQIIPVSTTVILIRLIEGFKIIDMPQALTYGAPGTASESVTLQIYSSWRALDLGGSAALAYLLLVVSTFVAVVYVTIIRRSLLERFQ